MSFQPLSFAMLEVITSQKHAMTGARATTIMGLSGSRTSIGPNEK
jgi:hypothetical protein